MGVVLAYLLSLVLLVTDVVCLLLAIDVWSAGMILLFFLTGKFPIFQSQDDMEALVEIATIIGYKQMEKIATLHSQSLFYYVFRRAIAMSQQYYIGRTFITNLPTIKRDGMPWQDFVERQTPDLRVPRPADPRFYPYHSRSEPAVTRIPIAPSHQDFSSSQSSHGRNNDSRPPRTLTSPSTAATSSSRQLQVPMSAPPSTSSRRLPRTLNKTVTVSSPPPPSANSRSRQPHNAVASSSRAPASSPSIDPEQAAYEDDIDNALDLLKKLMNPDSTKRITPRDALYHPFLREYRYIQTQSELHSGAPSSSLPSSVTTASPATVTANGASGRRGRGAASRREEDSEGEGEENNEDGDDEEGGVEGTWLAISDDEFFPHPPGEGVCAAWHFEDEDTGSLYVKIRVPAPPSSAGSGSSSSRTGLSRKGRKRMRGDGDEDGEADDVELRRTETKMKRLDAGEGMAIGRMPCEYHRNLPEFARGVGVS